MRHGVTSFLATLSIGVLTVGSVVHGEDTLPDDRLGFRTAPLLLLSRPDVRTDISLSPKQTAEVGQEIKDLFTRAFALRGKRDRTAEKARQEIDDAMQKWLESHLTEVQLRRLVEVDLQWEGPSALISRPMVGDRLTLTPSQRKNLKYAVEERNKQRAERGFRRDTEEQLAHKALEILNTEQRKTWKSMLGRAFVPKLASDSDPLRR